MYFVYRIKNIENIKKIILKISGGITIEELIKICIDKIESNDYGNYSIMMNHNIDRYNLKPAKKTGKANLDLPSK